MKRLSLYHLDVQNDHVTGHQFDEIHVVLYLLPLNRPNSSTPSPNLISVPRPAMLVAIVTAPFVQRLQQFQLHVHDFSRLTHHDGYHVFKVNLKYIQKSQLQQYLIALVALPCVFQQHLLLPHQIYLLANVN